MNVRVIVRLIKLVSHRLSIVLYLYLDQTIFVFKSNKSCFAQYNQIRLKKVLKLDRDPKSFMKQQQNMQNRSNEFLMKRIFFIHPHTVGTLHKYVLLFQLNYKITSCH